MLWLLSIIPSPHTHPYPPPPFACNLSPPPSHQVTWRIPPLSPTVTLHLLNFYLSSFTRKPYCQSTSSLYPLYFYAMKNSVPAFQEFSTKLLPLHHIHAILSPHLCLIPLFSDCGTIILSFTLPSHNHWTCLVSFPLISLQACNPSLLSGLH